MAGLAIVVGAAVVNGSFTTPMKYILSHNKNNPWRWEHVWLLYSIGTFPLSPFLSLSLSHTHIHTHNTFVGYFLFTWIGAIGFIGVEAITATYSNTKGENILLPMLFAFLWGVQSSLLGYTLSFNPHLIVPP